MRRLWFHILIAVMLPALASATMAPVYLGDVTQDLASYSISHDDNGNPQTQTASGTCVRPEDSRTFGVDALDRLTSTAFEGGQTETSTLDLVGNRESFTNRLGQTTQYTLTASPGGQANQYGTIGGAAIAYDAAGNLAMDERGRLYAYDEANRLKEIRASNGLEVLASYAYDALGRRISSTINDVTTRYYYDGQNVIEERDGADVRLRYHVHGTQYIDEHVATYSDTTGQFSYYLLGDNYSVVGTGNADGSAIRRVGYTPLGDFTGSGYSPADFNMDGQVDLLDYRIFAGHVNGPIQPGTGAGWQQTDLNGDGHVDLKDFLIFQECFGTNRPPPASGTFGMHGRPVDVIADPTLGGQMLVLQDFRARLYDVKNARWLQRDPSGYADGGNLYESFHGNASRFTDPSGLDSIETDGDWLVYKRSGFQYPFARDLGSDLVVIDYPWWPYAFIMKKAFVIGEFQRSWWTLGLEREFADMPDIMQHAMAVAMSAGSKSNVIAIFDKHQATAGWMSPDDVTMGSRAAEEYRALARGGQMRQVQGMAHLTGIAFTATTGLLAAPAGVGGMVADVVSTGADMATRKISFSSGAVVITAIAVGALLHERLAAGDEVPRGGPYEEVRAGNVGGQVNHVPAASVSPYSRARGPSIWMETADHMKTASWGSSKAAQAHRAAQEVLIKQGKLREAIKMDIVDIRAKFGSKYDGNIKEMLQSLGLSE